jgi:hypothetical protein
MSESITTIDPLGGNQTEVLAASPEVLITLMVVGLLVLFVLVLALWRWDVMRWNRPRQALESRIEEFVSAVTDWDFEAAEQAAVHALWTPPQEN